MTQATHSLVFLTVVHEYTSTRIATADYVTVGYKGTNPYDAGLFYCPYVPLTMVRAVGEENFQPKIGFKTRYGMASNPFVGATPANGLAAAKSNQYYRIFRVDNIMA
jgi:hypothetical protein